MTPQRPTRRLLLTSVESFSCDGKAGPPQPMEMITTCLFVLAMLIFIEYNLKQMLEYFQVRNYLLLRAPDYSILTNFLAMFFVLIFKHFHPLLENDINRGILARHVGVDAFSCFVVAILGWKASHINQDMVDALLRRTPSLPMAFENRVFKYYPEAVRISLFFFAYQIKNTYDTIVWNDGPEFIAHHILTLATAWGALVPGSCHYYAMFYFGVSEISTGVLCLLANFDDIHGVPGLATAFPVGKMVLGGLFAVLFVICRVFMWSTVSYYYCRDAWNALKSNDPRLEGRRTWLRFTFVSLSLLSVLQIIWLGEIVRIGHEELKNMGFLQV